MQGTNAEGGELAPGTDVGGYVVAAKIGEGGMGMVYSAQHPRIGKRVAIKVLAPAYCRDPGVVERFEQEARLVNDIHHANVIDVFQLGELPDGRKYFVMEWLEGESLSARIDRGPIAPRDAMQILDVVCDALQAVHEKGVIHRDLKSDNVFLAIVRGRQNVKLLDFGLAKLAGANNPKAITKTKTGIVVGTPAYMAPEQARGLAIDHRTDIYGLGVLAYKMLTGRLPFVGDTPVDLIIQHLKSPPPSPGDAVAGLPEPLSQVVVRMMAKSPDARPTLPEVRTVLASLLGEDAPAAPAEESAVRGVPLAFIGAAALLVATIIAAIVIVVSR